MAGPVVVAGCPVRNRGWILEKHLFAVMHCLGRVHEKTGTKAAMFYLPNDCEDDTESILESVEFSPFRPYNCWLDFRCQVFNTHAPGWHRGTRNSGWREGPHPRYHEDQCANLARVRNRWIDRALELFPQATHLWSCDSDVLPDPDVLELLLAADKDIVGAVVRNGASSFNFMVGWDEGEPVREGTEWEYVEEDGSDWGDDPFEVTLLGACVLMRREVLRHGVGGSCAECKDEDLGYDPQWFAPHPRGEDFPFCAGAREAGCYNLYIHPLARTSHHMEEGKEGLRP